MWRNNIKIAWRTLMKDRTYSIINIFGLTIGLASCMLVGTVVLDEVSYDKFWKNKNQLFRILTVETSAGMEGKTESAYMNLGAGLKENFPEVEAAGKITKATYNFRLDERSSDAIQMNLIQADTNVWDMLDFPILEGKPETYVAGVGNLVISQGFSKANFPNESPIGKVIHLVSPYLSESRPFLITGVIEDIPSNTYLRADGIQISAPSTTELNSEGWGYYEEQMILLKAQTDLPAFKEKVNTWYSNYTTDASEEAKKRLPTFDFQPIEDIYLKSEFASQAVKGSQSNVYLFSGIAFLLLLIACINFINLSAARSINRIREVGVRKVLGAGKKQLISQFLNESLLFFLIAGLLASSVYALSLVHLERFLGHDLEVNLFENGRLLIIFVAIVISLSVLAGLYPAWMVSGFAVSNSLKNRIGIGMNTSVPVIRKGLVAIQFVFAILVLIGTVTVWTQMNYMEKKDLGFDASHVLSLPSFATDGKADALKQKIAQISGVEHVSLSRWVPTKGAASMTKQIIAPDDPDQSIQVNYIIGDLDLPKVLGFNLIEGRSFGEQELNFSDSQAEETAEKVPSNVLMTASTADLLNVKELGALESNLEAIPIGIIEDFHSISLREPIKPTLIMTGNEFNYASVLIKLQEGKEGQVLSGINTIWSEIYSEKPLKFEWVDELVNKQYEKEQTQAQLFTFFSVLMLILAALGVFGLVVHATEQRVKEIGVRKVLGASAGNIVQLFSMDYMKLVGIALIIASPIAWQGMNTWLDGFAYKISLQWWMFAGAGMVAAVLALITVIVRVLWTTRINPVNSLRSE
ncbi:ABC transporter [Algoriphagus machipongonensis]|uniref:ABC transporter n=2 Tax=Algoriphagus machipongonensis TaxID=388413 RepID=A3HSJ6_9BACT|nr:ABC transporter [Algoriphagus machipongonensis]